MLLKYRLLEENNWGKQKLVPRATKVSNHNQFPSITKHILIYGYILFRDLNMKSNELIA